MMNVSTFGMLPALSILGQDHRKQFLSGQANCKLTMVLLPCILQGYSSWIEISVIRTKVWRFPVYSLYLFNKLIKKLQKLS